MFYFLIFRLDISSIDEEYCDVVFGSVIMFLTCI